MAAISIILDCDAGHDDAPATVEPSRWKPTFVLRGLEAVRVRV